MLQIFTLQRKNKSEEEDTNVVMVHQYGIFAFMKGLFNLLTLLDELDFFVTENKIFSELEHVLSLCVKRSHKT